MELPGCWIPAGYLPGGRASQGGELTRRSGSGKQQRWWSADLWSEAEEVDCTETRCNSRLKWPLASSHSLPHSPPPAGWRERVRVLFIMSSRSASVRLHLSQSSQYFQCRETNCWIIPPLSRQTLSQQSHKLNPQDPCCVWLGGWIPWQRKHKHTQSQTVAVRFPSHDVQYVKIN